MRTVGKLNTNLMPRFAAYLLLLLCVGLTAPAQAQSRADAKAIQSMLNELGLPVGRPDGAAGRKTKGAIRKYQKQHGLLVDGSLAHNSAHTCGKPCRAALPVALRMARRIAPMAPLLGKLRSRRLQPGCRLLARLTLWRNDRHSMLRLRYGQIPSVSYPTVMYRGSLHLPPELASAFSNAAVSGLNWPH